MLSGDPAGIKRTAVARSALRYDSGPKGIVKAALRLNADPQTLRDTFLSADPFPHVVVDGLFPDETLDRLLDAFPEPGAEGWRRFDNGREKKLASLPPLLSGNEEVCDFLCAASSPPMLEFLEALTGIGGLIPDPYFGGGGLHQIVRGGFLEVHADFNWHPKLRLDRRLNVLVYLNKEWREEYGGHLELWDRELRGPVRSILPVFNRTVVFATTDSSYHGHPKPLSCPVGTTRKSVSLYYYSNGRPEWERSRPHDTLFPASAEEGR